MPESAFVRSLKIVYWGPGLGGKTTNLTFLHERLRPDLRGKLISLDSPGERTIYFDCLPLDLDPIGGRPIRLRLYTVPGQPRFQLTRRLVLEGTAGLVFVWDSRPPRLRANILSLLEAREAVPALGGDWARFPRVVQFNKQDLPGAMPVARCREVLEKLGEPSAGIAASALTGRGVLETLTEITRAALRSLTSGPGALPGSRVSLRHAEGGAASRGSGSVR